MDVLRHRVDREIAPCEVIVDALAKGDFRLPRNPVVDVCAESRDLRFEAVLREADRAELLADEPHRIGPGLDPPPNIIRPRIGGQIEVPGLPAEKLIAQAAPDQEEPAVGEGPGKLLDQMLHLHRVPRRIRGR